MADSWYDWLQGTPEQGINDLAAQKKQLEDIRASQVDRQLKRLGDRPVYTSGGGYDPRELRMAAMQDQLTPERTTDAGQAMAGAANYALDFGGRMRDTAFTAAAEAARGNNALAAQLAARSVGAGAIPSLGAGMRGQPDDWRNIAATNGVSSNAIMAYDLLTDPENWVTSPLRAPLNMVIPGVGMRMAGAAGRVGDDVLRGLGRAVDSARPAYDASDAIRRLRATH